MFYEKVFAFLYLFGGGSHRLIVSFFRRGGSVRRHRPSTPVLRLPSSAILFRFNAAPHGFRTFARFSRFLRYFCFPRLRHTGSASPAFFTRSAFLPFSSQPSLFPFPSHGLRSLRLFAPARIPSHPTPAQSGSVTSIARPVAVTFTARPVAYASPPRVIRFRGGCATRA